MSNLFLYQSKRNSVLSLTTSSEVNGNKINFCRTAFLRQDEKLPLLPLPKKLDYGWKNSAIVFDVKPADSLGALINQRDPIKVPLIDTIGTNFLKEEMPIQYTIWNILFLSDRTGTKSESKESTTFSLSYALDILKAIGKESAGEITGEYSKQFETTMSFFIENSKALWQLEDKSTRNNENYKQQIAEVEYNENKVGEPTGNDFLSGLRREYPVKPSKPQKMVKVGQKLAESFMRRINDQMTTDLKAHFDGLANQMPKREVRGK